MAKKQNTSIYQDLTNEIIADLKNNNVPWKKTWKGGGALSLPLRHNGAKYQGINVVSLWVRSIKKGYTSPYWFTFNQSHKLGAQVKKGEKGTPVYYASAVCVKEQNADGEEEENEIYYMKKYTVFNAEQIECLPEEYYPKEEELPDTVGERDQKIDSFIDSLPMVYEYQGTQPKYNLTDDKVVMPTLKHFYSANGFYEAFFHEMTHWTGHKTRLDRFKKGHSERGADYAFEELIAHLGACFLQADFGIVPDLENTIVPYIKGWIELLENDERAIFRAASAAQKAINYMYEKSNIQKD